MDQVFGGVICFSVLLLSVSFFASFFVKPARYEIIKALESGPKTLSEIKSRLDAVSNSGQGAITYVPFCKVKSLVEILKSEGLVVELGDLYAKNHVADDQA